MPDQTQWVLARPLRLGGRFVLLGLFLCACNFAANLPDAAPQPDLTVWSKTESPLFPSEWPPTASTIWVSYTFAYGTNPQELADGAYVTRPLSKTEWTAGGSTTTVLTDEMTREAIQGVAPLDDQAQAILENREPVSAYCLALTGLPDPALPETQQLLAYYRAWFQTNGAFLGLVREDHAGFIDWVETNP